jgi:homocysteine S-methyltransferase
MSKYRHRLPLLKGDLFLTDGGLETTLIFHEGVTLNSFAAFELLNNEAGIAQLHKYFATYVDIARAQGVGIVLESATWRANADWATKLGYDSVTLADANRKAIGLLLEVRAKYEDAKTKIVVSGNIGPRGDGYNPTHRMTVQEAKQYHLAQIQTFASTDADMVGAFTMNYPEEAVGIALAAKECSMPVAISFTLETDGRLPSGDTLLDAIRRVDAVSDNYPAYYLINCAHPTHFAHVLGDNAVSQRIRGLRANASRRSHAELDACSDLDIGDPMELARQYRSLKASLPQLSIVGGCCGTDHRHVDEICKAMQMH